MDELSDLFGGAGQVWQYIKQYAAKAGREATRIVLESYYVVKSPNTPALDKTIIIAALGYQLLPNDLMSKEKYGWLGFLDNGAALALAYNRVKTRVTSQIEAQVDAILNQWFGTEQSQIENIPGHPQLPDGYDFGDDYRDDGQSVMPKLPENPVVPDSFGVYDDNEEVVID